MKPKLILGFALILIGVSNSFGAADAGSKSSTNPNLNALYNDGLKLFSDLSDEASLKKGFALFEQAAKEGHADALNAVGVAKLFGFGTQMTRMSVGIESIQKASEAGSLKALYNLSSLIFFKIGIKGDAKQGLNYLEQAALKGDVESQYQLGKLLLDPNIAYDSEKALQWFKKAAEHGNKDASAFVGALNLSTGIKNPDNKMGLTRLRELSDEGVASAKYFLGEYFAELDSDHADPALALKYLIQSQALGFPKFPLQKASSLIRQIADGKITEPQFEKAVAFLEAQQTTNCLANCLLGQLYTVSGSKHKDYAKGKSIFEKGAQMGCVMSAIKLADMHVEEWSETGSTTEGDVLKAKDYYSSAVKRDKSGEAAFKFAALIYNLAAAHPGRDLTDAYKMALEAAKRGNKQTYDLMAAMLIYGGTGESEPEEKAYAWAILAQESKQKGASFSKLEKELTKEQKLEGEKISQFFKVMIRRRAITDGEKSFRF